MFHSDKNIGKIKRSNKSFERKKKAPWNKGIRKNNNSNSNSNSRSSSSSNNNNNNNDNNNKKFLYIEKRF